MTHLLNNPVDFPVELVDGFVKANSKYVKKVYGGVVRATKSKPGKVAIITGGGTGHYPGFMGWVGPGLVDGAVTGNILKINSVAAGTVNLTSDVTTGTVNLYTGTTTGTINIGSATSLVEMGIVELNNQLRISSAETTGITTTATAVSTFATATYRSAKYTVQVECTAGTDVGRYQVSEILMLHDGTTATMTDYAVIRTGNNLVTFTADISAPNARLLATATTGNTIKVRVVQYLNSI
jgi:hypothetical protein